MAAARLVGTPVPRREDARLLLGQARFVADITVPRTLYMAIVRSTKAHAVIEAIDTSRAIAAPGVARVVVGSEIADTVGALPSIDLAGSGTAACCRVLSIGKVRYVGEPVAVVFAERLTQANEAADLVDIQYRDLPVVLDTEQAVEQPPSLLYEQLGSNVISTVSQNVGDTDAAFAGAFRVFEDTFRIHRYVAAPMETRGVLADPTGRNGRVTL
jgi:carbon-monoxide dehydrogenase large subunit